jgi:hypothetical protein
MIRQGADINIVQLDGKLQFEIDPKRLENKKLVATKSLLNLGISSDSGSTRKTPRLESVDDTSSVPR